MKANSIRIPTFGNKEDYSLNTQNGAYQKYYFGTPFFYFSIIIGFICFYSVMLLLFLSGK